jgi:hypothetical protein
VTAKPRSRTFEVLLLVVVVAVAVPVIVVAARGLGSRDGAAVAPVTVSKDVQSCASCWIDNGSPSPDFPGEAVIEGGAQVLRVGLVEGYYRPNRFTVTSDLPVTVIFTGYAEDCLGEPEFPELGVKGNLDTGTLTLDLGRLKPGTYIWTCSMGVNEGKITVK